MNEGKRIEGQMFLRGGVGWTIVVVALLVGAGMTLVVGYAINRWINYAAATGVQVLGGGTVAGGTATWAGPMAGLPVPGTVTVDSVQWPVAAGGAFREHWEKKVPGTGTLNMWYMDPASKQGWQWGSAISIPVQGENRFVIVVNLPRGFEPAESPGGQIWVCELGMSPVGDVMPVDTTTQVRAVLTAAQVKHLWEKDFPPELVQDLIDAANGRGPLYGTARVPAQNAYQLFTPIDRYFETPATEEASGDEPE